MKTPLLTAEEMRAADQSAIDSGTPEVALMQRAGSALAEIIRVHYPPCRLVVMCGPGNNGWDGKIAARHLREAGFTVSEFSPKDDYQPELLTAELILDALLGTGLNKEVKGDIARAIAAMNASGAPIIACDIASGVNATTGEVMGCAVKAARTVTFASAKRGHYLLPGKAHKGTLHVVDIGIPVNSPGAYLNNSELWKLPKRQLADHKYKRGHALVMGGPLECTGASKLTATAALKTGAGAVSILCDDETLPVYAASLMAVMTKPFASEKMFEALISEERVSALAIGPGAGVSKETAKRTEAMLATGKPCLLDADALQKDMLAKAHEHTVITPHHGEFTRLFGEHRHKIDAVEAAVNHFSGVIVYKGNDTVIAQRGKTLIINGNAPSTLATAGSGDVLAGIITGLLAQGMNAFDAACAGVWLHGEAGRAAGKFYTADELIAKIGSGV